VQARPIWRFNERERRLRSGEMRKATRFLGSIAHLPGPKPRVFTFSRREGFIAGRFIVLQMVHGLAKGGEFFVHAVTGTALVAERTMLRNAVPGIKRKDARKCDLLWRIELLFGYAQDRNRDTR
jgi:hypothetical protein